MMQKSLFYIANIRLPTEKAHGLQVMKMCEVFSRQGYEVTLVVPRRLNALEPRDPFAYYGIGNRFRIIRVPCLDTVRFGRIGFYLQSLTFGVCAFVRLFFTRANLCITRDPVALMIGGLLKRNFIHLLFEAHNVYGWPTFFLFFLRKSLLLTITKALKDRYIALGVAGSRILVAPDGVDEALISLNLSKEEARKHLSLSPDVFFVVYTGHLYDWKGFGTLTAAAALAREKDIEFLCVGGTENDIARVKNTPLHPSVRILGHRPFKEVVYWQRAADVLVLPNTAHGELSARYTSPLKLFEYMASGRPIIASDIPSLREILNSNNALFFTPDDPRALLQEILEVKGNYSAAEKKGLQAQRDVRVYTWDNRASAILQFLTSSGN